MWTLLAYRNYQAFTWPWSWRRSIVFGAFAAAYGIWQAITTGIMLDDWRTGVGTAVLFVPMCLLVASLGPLLAAWVRARGWPKRSERLGVVLAVLFGTIAAGGGEWVANRYMLDVVMPKAVEQQLINPVDLRMETAIHGPIGWIAAAVLFFLLNGGLALVTYFGEQRRLEEEARMRQLGELRLQKRQADLELMVLQAQVEPHFLFNTLASLRSLLRQDVGHAESMIDALVEHLRAAMPMLRKGTEGSTLAEQLRLCGSYLEVMMVRMSDRLTYAIDISDDLRNAPFPPLLLLTLVENAVKHGIEPKPGPGHIRIEGRRESRPDGRHIIVSVIDNGKGLSAGVGSGVGLANIRAQLALKYGDRAALVLMGGVGGGAVATVDIPEHEPERP